jgi:hypothetical protein
MSVTDLQFHTFYRNTPDIEGYSLCFFTPSGRTMIVRLDSRALAKLLTRVAEVVADDVKKLAAWEF